MTERQIENRVKKLKAIEKQRKDLEAQEKALRKKSSGTWKARVWKN